MLSAEQLIVVAYCHDGSILCRRCGERNPETKMGEAMSAYEAQEYAGRDGLTCEDCGKEIIEAYQWTCPDCDETYYGDEAESKESDHDEDGCGGRLCTGAEKDEDEDEE